jgi:hypothetical protein
MKISRLAVPFVIVPLLLACGGPSAPAPAPAAPVEITRIVEVTVPVEATRLVEVTRDVEVTRVVEVTVPVEVTRLVVAATEVPTATPSPVPAAKPAQITPDQVVAAFKAAGLEAESIRPLTKDDYGIAPYVGTGLRFLIPSLGEDNGGRIFSVDNPEDLQRLKRYYDEMGKASAMLFSWAFAKDNILVQINGDLPEDKARQYEAALNSLGR